MGYDTERAFGHTYSRRSTKVGEGRIFRGTEGSYRGSNTEQGVNMTTIDSDAGGRQRRTDDRRMGYDRRGSLIGWTAPQGNTNEGAPDGGGFSNKRFHLRSFEKRRQGDERRRETRGDLNAAPGGPGFLRVSESGIRPHPALPPTLVAAINEIIADCRDRVLARQKRTGKADKAEVKVWQMVDYCVALNSVIKAAVDHHGPNRDLIASALHAASQALFPDPELAHAAFTSALKETARQHGDLGWSSIHETMGRA